MKKALIFTLLCILFIFTLTGCSDSYTASDLRDAQTRYNSGKYTREDERMVEGFNRWKADKDKYID